MKILILNGSLHGASANSGMIIKSLIKAHKEIQWEVVNLKSRAYGKSVAGKIRKADALLIMTGTYWDSWGSPLQKFFEEASELEADPRILGKPVGACVLMHSVGGKEVLSRLQGVLSSMGFLVPPMSGMAYSLSGQLALRENSQHADDFWSLDDLAIIVENLKSSAKIKMKWAVWPVDRKNFRQKWVRNASSNKKSPAETGL